MDFKNDTESKNIKIQKSNYHQRNLARHFWFIFRKIIKIFWYTNSQFKSCFPAKQIVYITLCIE